MEEEAEAEAAELGLTALLIGTGGLQRTEGRAEADEQCGQRSERTQAIRCMEVAHSEGTRQHTQTRTKHSRRSERTMAGADGAPYLSREKRGRGEGQQSDESVQRIDIRHALMRVV